jgi:hypothetical protein
MREPEKKAIRAIERLAESDPVTFEGVKTAEDLIQRNREVEAEYRQSNQGGAELESLRSDQAKNVIARKVRELSEEFFNEIEAAIDGDVSEGLRSGRDRSSLQGDLLEDLRKAEEIFQAETSASRTGKSAGQNPPAETSLAGGNKVTPEQLRLESKSREATDVVQEIQRSGLPRAEGQALVDAILDAAQEEIRAQAAQSGKGTGSGGAAAEGSQTSSLTASSAGGATSEAGGSGLGQGRSSPGVPEQPGGRRVNPGDRDYWLQEAGRAGIGYGNLRESAQEILAEDLRAVREHNAILAETRKLLSEYSGAAKLIRLERYGDSSQVPGIDQVADHWARRNPTYGDPDALFEMLKQGNRKSMSMNDAYQKALEYLGSYVFPGAWD